VTSASARLQPGPLRHDGGAQEEQSGGPWCSCVGGGREARPGQTSVLCSRLGGGGRPGFERGQVRRGFATHHGVCRLGHPCGERRTRQGRKRVAARGAGWRLSRPLSAVTSWLHGEAAWRAGRRLQGAPGGMPLVLARPLRSAHPPPISNSRPNTTSRHLSSLPLSTSLCRVGAARGHYPCPHAYTAPPSSSTWAASPGLAAASPAARQLVPAPPFPAVWPRPVTGGTPRQPPQVARAWPSRRVSQRRPPARRPHGNLLPFAGPLQPDPCTHSPPAGAGAARHPFPAPTPPAQSPSSESGAARPSVLLMPRATPPPTFCAVCRRGA
jgi:hypothetical protein